MKLTNFSGPWGTIKPAAIVSSLLVLPLIVLESVNSRDFPRGFPIVLFGFIWLMALSFMVILMPLVPSRKAGSRTFPNSGGLVARLLILILIAWMLGGLTLDQMPCFLGVPNCD